MKKNYLFICLLALCIATTSCRKSTQAEAEVPVVLDTIPQMVMQIQKCSRLYTAEYKIHKIVTHDDVMRLKGNILKQDFNIALPMGERKIAIPMDATLKAYIDFEGFSEQNIERHGDHITIMLPDPKVVMTSSKINQKDIKEYVGLTRSHFTDKEMTGYEQQGRQAILNRAAEMGIVETARENAARVLVPMLTEMGYQEQNVTIAFRKGLDVRQLLNMSIENNHE